MSESSSNPLLSSQQQPVRVVTLWCLCALAAVLLSVSTASAQAAANSSPAFHATTVAKRATLLSGPDANVLVFASDSTLLLVDAGESATTEALARAVRKISDLPVRTVIVTHYHSDHLGGAAYWRAKGATVLAHENVLTEALKDTLVREFDWHRTPVAADALPSRTFRDSIALNIGTEQITVVHLDSAHTNGDVVVWFHESDVIDAGDILSTPPGIDLSAGGSIDGMIRAFDSLLAMAGPETRIVPGHGSPTNRAHLVAYRDMLQTLRARVDSGIARGSNLKQIQDSSPAAGYDALLGGKRIGPQLVRLLYLERQQEKHGR